jgi:outer membrane protein
MAVLLLKNGERVNHVRLDVKPLQNRKWHWVLITVGTLVLGFTTTVWAQEAIHKLSVDQAIQIAMESSLQRRMAQDNVKIAQDKLAQASSAFGPKLTLDGGYNHYNDQPSNAQLAQGIVDLNNGLAAMYPGLVTRQSNIDDGLNYYGYRLQLSQPLYTGKKLTATKKTAQANHQSARANLAVTNNDLILAVKKAYYTVLLCQQMEATMDEAVASMENHLREAYAYFQAELVPKLDVLRAEEKLADLKQKQLWAQNNLILAKKSFNFVLGVDLNTNYAFENKMGSGQLPQERDLNAYQTEALARRPELVDINAKIEIARQGVVIAKSGNKPTVALVAEAHHYDPINEEPDKAVGVVATMKLYDHGMVKHQIAEAEDTLRQARTGKEQLERGIKLEVEQAYRNVAVAFKTIEVARKNLATAQETLEVAQTRYKVGLSNSLERVDAEVGLTQAKTNYTQALSTYNIALAELDRAIGKGNSSK